MTRKTIHMSNMETKKPDLLAFTHQEINHSLPSIATGSEQYSIGTDVLSFALTSPTKVSLACLPLT